jgi:hypothetical protein
MGTAEGPNYRYITNESRKVWNDGLYRISFWDAITGKPVSANQIEIIDDEVVTWSNYSSVISAFINALKDSITSGFASVFAMLKKVGM